MRVEHSFDIYAKLYMPTHHFEFYVSFFSYVLVTYSVLWCVVYVILSCGKLSIRLSVCLSVCLPVPAFANTFHLWLHWYFIRWLETPTACDSQIFKVIWQISRSHRPKKKWNGSNQGFSGIFWRTHGGRAWNTTYNSPFLPLIKLLWLWRVKPKCLWRSWIRKSLTTGWSLLIS